MEENLELMGNMGLVRLDLLGTRGGAISIMPSLPGALLASQRGGIGRYQTVATITKFRSSALGCFRLCKV